ncbi:FecR domain-containing protein [Pokkaliibacter sp. MBI-7]|uniref:FecR domain-containing protein n=1 Tax=Pokkaliibacter sp. MBI-7 TaxID=3040600 RepID=UPI00244C9AD6|nr:FecR domain-containing protein [Pokkaliibacter sp. MBI-7]MDH2432724.1 FecR domain-containing protein [Pokkaliibacter sp. MBI-7]
MTMNPSESTPIAPHIARQAVQWWVDLQADDLTVELEQRLQQWRDADSEHERAWQRIESIHGRWQQVPGRLARATLLPLQEQSRALSRRQAVKLLTNLLIVGGSGWMLWQGTPWQDVIADYHTAPGEQRQVELEDGSLLWLNTNTSVAVQYSDSERRLRLYRGEVLLESAHQRYQRVDPRPLRVRTEQGTVEALGTRFRVYQQQDETEVAVLDGAVAIEPVQDGSRRTVLQAGQQTRFSRFSSDDPQPREDSRDAWLNGMLVARNQRLDQFLAELARYRRGHLGCDDGVAALRVSGTYPLRDTDAILAAIEALLPVRQQRLTRYWINLAAAY